MARDPAPPKTLEVLQAQDCHYFNGSGITQHTVHCLETGPSVLLHAFTCPTLRHPGLQPARLLCPWDSPGKNTAVSCHALLQGVFSTQGPNLSLCLLHWPGRFFTTSASI